MTLKQHISHVAKQSKRYATKHKIKTLIECVSCVIDSAQTDLPTIA